LRVHKPQRFGDKINRFTMLEAESISSTSSGIELGTLGTFTLRHVTPWYDSNQKLIGYVELGMEIDSIFDSIEQYHSTTLYMLIAKKFLNKDSWIEGMAMLGHKDNWDLLDQFVVTNLREGRLLTDDFIKQYASPETVVQGGFSLAYNNHNYQAMFIPIVDKGKRNVGNMWVFINTDDIVYKSNRLILISTSISTALGILLLVLFFRLVSGIESELRKHQQALRKLATFDGLTGVYNRRSFDMIIVSEFERARRYNKDLSLLIVDIDHFKLVNDKYGHIAGDSVLKELAAKLSGRIRTNDHLARYGGEEFVIILPETPLDMAHLFAERVRTSVGEKDFKVGNNLTALLTLSIGISSFPAQANTIKELVEFADSALYVAKETGRNRVCDFKPDSEASS
jgi:diguanylate cyclase (GGDEF)-like protein